MVGSTRRNPTVPGRRSWTRVAAIAILTITLVAPVTTSAAPDQGVAGLSPSGVRSTRTSPSTSFTVAVMPDTQMEVHSPSDGRLRQRSQWLADHKASLNLRFVTHIGDVVDWDTPDHRQTKVASEAMKPLEAADIPYTLALGNHDSQATGEGGSARDPGRTREQQRQTETFNSFFSAARFGAVRGAFETGKVDNLYSTFAFNGTSWLVLNLELWPRVSAVNWARNVVATHPDFNVIVVTHSYLRADLTISASSEYGDTSPQYLYDHLVKVYPNVRLVLSGHAGTAGQRLDVGVHGNKIVTYLQTFHDRVNNPIRLVQIDTARNSCATYIYAPRNGQTFPRYADVQYDMDWVQPAAGPPESRGQKPRARR